MRAALAVCFFFAAFDTAAQDLGTGRDGPLVVSGRQTVNRYSPLRGDLSAGSQFITVSVANLQPGELVMLLQSQLSDVPFSGGAASYYLDAQVNVGSWELVRVLQTVDAGVYALEQPTRRSYKARGAQAVSVPEFTTLTIADAGVLTGLPWDGFSGGVVAALVQDELAAFGVIHVNGMGFRGAANLGNTGEGISASGYSVGGTTQASVSGGPMSSGGSNAGMGGRGVSFAFGGSVIKTTPGDRLLFGGGGGRQDAWGGAGGGVIFLRANRASGSGRFSSNGLAGDGAGAASVAGGGGAGGTIDLRVHAELTCSLLQANGGRGGSNSQWTDNRAGGGGSGGRIYLEATGAACAPEAVAGARGDMGPGVPNWSQPADGTDPSYAGEVVVVADAGTNDTAEVTLVSPRMGALLNTPRPVIAGRATAEVHVLLDGTEAGTAPPLADAGFMFFPSADLSDGPHRVQARVGTAMTSAITFTIDTTPPPRPELLAPRNGAVLATATPSIEGTAPEGTRLELLLDGRVLLTEVVPSSGTFLTAVPAARFLEQGAHSLDATVFDQAGNSSRDHVDFTVGRTPMDPGAKVQSGCSVTTYSPWSLLLFGWVFAALRSRTRRASVPAPQ